MFGAIGGALATTSVTFVSQAALTAGIPEKLRLQKRAVAVRGTRTVTKRDMVHNALLPKIEVDPQTYDREASVVLTGRGGQRGILPGLLFSVVVKAGGCSACVPHDARLAMSQLPVLPVRRGFKAAAAVT